MHVIGVDVGTTSVRLAILRLTGANDSIIELVSSHKKDISHQQKGHRFEQNSREIWEAVCECSNEAVKKANVPADSIGAIGFSATCSLVIVDDNEQSGNYSTHSHGDKKPNDIIMWMDHRAKQEAHVISQSGSTILKQIGNVCSPEFSLAKLIWLKENEPARFQSASGFFELPDWLVFKCLGCEPESSPRSLCSLVCKWGFQANSFEHCDEIKSLDASLNKFGSRVLYPGTSSGFLCQGASIELGLGSQQQIRVATSLIDAHSGSLGLLSIGRNLADAPENQELSSICCSLTGTSSCHLILSEEKNLIQGIWGPYKNVIFKDYYLLEAGQSLTGKLIEICIESHEQGKLRLAKGEKMYDIISDLNGQLANENSEFVSQLHILPFYHGNRSPLANSRLKGGIYGLSADSDTSLLQFYAATLDSLVYENRLIFETLSKKPATILVSGGLTNNSHFMQTLATVLNCRVLSLSLQDLDFMALGAGLVARNCLLNGDSPLTEASISQLEIKAFQMKTYEPQEKLINQHERRFLAFQEFVQFSLKMDKILS